jgi:hypothetical protein
VLTPVIFLLASCGGGGSSSSAVDAGAPVSVAGSEIVFNPRIKFLDETKFEYDNTLSTNSDFPLGVVTGTYATELNKASRKLTLILSATVRSKFDGTPLELILSECKDEEGDGLIDSFSYTASHGSVQKEGGGIFTGGKPANPDASSSNVADVTGAPTLAEWEKYEVGKNVVEIDDEGNFGYWRLTSASTYEAHYQAQDRSGISGTVSGTYAYEKTGPSTGTFTVSDSLWGGVIRLEFIDFFNGTWVTDDAKDHNGNTVTEQGEWRTISDVSILE